jgi:hypothetical protein
MNDSETKLLEFIENFDNEYYKKRFKNKAVFKKVLFVYT